MAACADTEPSETASPMGMPKRESEQGMLCSRKLPAGAKDKWVRDNWRRDTGRSMDVTDGIASRTDSFGTGNHVENIKKQRAEMSARCFFLCDYEVQGRPDALAKQPLTSMAVVCIM